MNKDTNELCYYLEFYDYHLHFPWEKGKTKKCKICKRIKLFKKIDRR